MRLGSTSLLLLLLVSIGTPGQAQAESRGRFGFVAGPSRLAPFPYVDVGGRPIITFPGASGAPLRGRPAPWRHDPDPGCLPPTCLPSYWRPVYPPLPRHGPLLPLAAVFERLERISYRPYAATLAGPNYWIDALDDHQRAVLLIVNAKTGMIRRSLP